MTDCISKLSFGHYKNRKIEGDFSGGNLSKDGGLVFLGQIESQLKLVQLFSSCIDDPRNPELILHTQQELIQQRIFQICAGYEDCNDSNILRSDEALKVSCGRSPGDVDLGSQSTVSRLENRISLSDISKLRSMFIDTYLSSFTSTPDEIVLDIDSFCDKTHGQQEMTFFHGFYGCHMYHPVFINDAKTGYPIMLQLRAGNSHAGKGIKSLLRWLFWRIRNKFPGVKIIMRGDAGFSLPEILNICERCSVNYVFGYTTNDTLKKKSANLLEEARLQHCRTGQKVRLFDDVYYQSSGWGHYRRVIIKAEWLQQGSNRRYVVTDLHDDAQAIYDGFYVQRGETSENRIKELKLDMKADRLSCSQFISNQFRLFLHQAAFVFMLEMRNILKGTKFAKARFETIRNHILKCAVRVTMSVRRIFIQFASSVIEKAILIHINQKLNTT